MANKSANRRRQIIVDAPTQTRMVVRSTGLPLVVLTLGAIAMVLMSDGASERSGGPGTEGFSNIMFMVLSIGFILSVGGVAVAFSLRQSHRFAGPAIRLQKSIERMCQGDYDFEVTLRPGDELQAVADELNRLLVILREREAASAAPEGETVPHS